MTTLNIPGAAITLARSVILKQGGTVSLVMGVPKPTSGYAVSLPGSDRKHSVKGIGLTQAGAVGVIRDWAVAYAVTHRDTLAQPGHFLGAWIDGDEVVFDVTQVVPELWQAVRSGVDRDQDAIYNLGDDVELFLKRKRLTTVHPEQLRVWELLDDHVGQQQEANKAEPFTVVGAAQYDAATDQLSEVGTEWVTLKPQPGDLDYVPSPFTDDDCQPDRLARVAFDKLTDAEAVALYEFWTKADVPTDLNELTPTQ